MAERNGKFLQTIPDATWIKWKRKRKNTLIAFCLLSIIEGIDNSVVLSTLFLYLKTSVNTNHPLFFYSIISASFYVFSVVCGLAFGRWLDKTRRVRLFTNLTLLVEILGFLLYSIPYHPAFLLIGRCLCGISEPFMPVVSGEVIRIYNNEQSASALMLLSSMFYVGFTIGPVLNFFFKNVSFKFISFQVNYLNFIGLFMAGLLLVVLIIVNFLIHDCSKEIDLKELLSKKTQDGMDMKKIQNKFQENQSFAIEEEPPCDNNISISEEDNQKIEDTKNVENSATKKENIENIEYGETNHQDSVRTILKTLFTTPDMVAIMLSAFINMFIFWSSLTLFPVVMATIHNWTAVTIGKVFMLQGILNLCIFLIISKYFKSSRSIYNIAVIGIISQIVMWITLVCLNYIKSSLAFEYVTVVVFATANSIGFLEYFMVRIILSKMVSSRNQSFVEGIRSGVAKFSTLLAICLSAAVAKYLQWFSIPLMTGAFGLLICYIARSKSLQNPKILSL